MATTRYLTIKPGGGGNYLSMEDFASSEAADITTGGTDEIIDVTCYGGLDTGSTNQHVWFSQWTSSATNYINIHAATEAEARVPYVADGLSYTLQAPSSGSVARSYGIINAEKNHIRLTGLQLHCTSTYPNTDMFGNVDGNANNMVVNRCQLVQRGTNANWIAQFGKFYNCVILMSGSTNVATQIRFGSSLVVEGCTIVNYGSSSVEIVRDYFGSNQIFRNTIVYEIANTRNDWIGSTSSFASCSNIATSDATAPGPSAVINISDPFVDINGNDLRLSGNGEVERAAVNLTSDQYDYSVDFAGVTRRATGSWDLGAFEYRITPTTDGVSSLINVQSITWPW